MTTDIKISACFGFIYDERLMSSTVCWSLGAVARSIIAWLRSHRRGFTIGMMRRGGRGRFLSSGTLPCTGIQWVHSKRCRPSSFGELKVTTKHRTRCWSPVRHFFTLWIFRLTFSVLGELGPFNFVGYTSLSTPCGFRSYHYNVIYSTVWQWHCS